RFHHAAGGREWGEGTDCRRPPWQVVDEEILPGLTLESVFGDLRGLKPDGRFWQARCPIHEGDEPGALSIEPERLEWVCFLGCGGGGPVQFLQKTRDLSWVESAQALAIMAGVDPVKLENWGRHWTEDEFQRHARLELRSSLLGILVAFSRALFLSGAGNALRSYLSDRQGLPEEKLKGLDLGLYTAPPDVFHYLKKSGQELEELRRAGLFDPRWTGRILVPWRDLSGRIINLWGWDPSSKVKQHSARRCELLIKNDPYSTRDSLFQLDQARRCGRRDLILFDDPLQALIPSALGLQDPFPVSAFDGLTPRHVPLLENFLGQDGSLTLCCDYRADTYGSSKDSLARSLRILKGVGFPVFVVDSKLLSEGGEKRSVSVVDFIQEKGAKVFGSLIRQSEVKLGSEEFFQPKGDSSRKTLLQVIRGLTRPQPPENNGAGTDGDEETARFLAPVLRASEAIGQRIASGFLKALPGGLASLFLSPPGPGGSEVLQDPTRRLDGGIGSLPQLPAHVADEPPQAFSVDRLEQESCSAVLVKHSGWREVDDLGVRFRPGELVVIGAQTGHGKTSTLLNLLVNWLGRTHGASPAEGFVFFSIEESEVQIYHRLLSLSTALAGRGWALSQVRDHLSSPPGEMAILAGDRLEALEQARQRLRAWESRLHVVYRPTWTLAQIENHALQLAGRLRIGALLLDPLDQIALRPACSDPYPSLPVSRRLKKLAVQLACPVVVSLRARKKTKKGDAKRATTNSPRPRLEDFAGGAIEEADLVLGLRSQGAHSLSHLQDGNRPLTANRLEIGALKNRSGPAGQWVTLPFQSQFCLLGNPPLDP
ncbi:MAG: DnaB-like helicase C-terminal domain-containing protein, partial [Acidobacteriota bacterium]